MTIGQIPVRERIYLPRRGAPLEAVLTGASAFAVGTTGTVNFYDKSEELLAFWPVTVSGVTITIDISGEDIASLPDCCWFTVFVTYPSEPTKKRPWYEGAALRGMAT